MNQSTSITEGSWRRFPLTMDTLVAYQSSDEDDSDGGIAAEPAPAPSATALPVPVAPSAESAAASFQAMSRSLVAAPDVAFKVIYVVLSSKII